VSLSRRVTVVEASLSPTQLVLRWLAETHAFGDVEPYVASLLAHDHPVAPLDRLAREAAHGARTAIRGKRPEVAAAAVRSALRETVFRFELREHQPSREPAHDRRRESDRGLPQRRLRCQARAPASSHPAWRECVARYL